MRAARSFVALAAALVMATLASPAHAGCYDADGCVEEAKSAKAFTQSAGVNTHLGYSNTVYWQRWDDVIKPRLQELGVSHIRDGTFPASYPDVIGPTVAGRYKELGLGLNLLAGHEQGAGGGHPATTLAQRLDWIKSNGLASQVIGVEGDSERYIGVDHKDDWEHDAAAIDDLRRTQCDIYNRVKGDTAFSGVKVIGPSAGLPAYEDVWDFHVTYNRGDLAACMDFGNLHPYPGDDPPHLHQDRDLDYAKAWSYTAGNRPFWITENGYYNTLSDPNGLSEQAAGVYVPRMLAEMFRRGFERAQLYELVDLNTSSSAVIDRFGLLRTDGTPKPAFTGLKNLLALTKDANTASGWLGFGIACTANCHSPIRHVLLKHSDGTYRLVYWSESRVWNDAYTPQADQSITVKLHDAPGRVDVYQVDRGTSPIKSDTSGSETLGTRATDQVRVLKITPAV